MGILNYRGNGNLPVEFCCKCDWTYKLAPVSVALAVLTTHYHELLYCTCMCTQTCWQHPLLNIFELEVSTNQTMTCYDYSNETTALLSFHGWWKLTQGCRMFTTQSGMVFAIPPTYLWWWLGDGLFIIVLTTYDVKKMTIHWNWMEVETLEPSQA